MYSFCVIIKNSLKHTQSVKKLLEEKINTANIWQLSFTLQDVDIKQIKSSAPFSITLQQNEHRVHHNSSFTSNCFLTASKLTNTWSNSFPSDLGVYLRQAVNCLLLGVENLRCYVLKVLFLDILMNSLFLIDPVFPPFSAFPPWITFLVWVIEIFFVEGCYFF